MMKKITIRNIVNDLALLDPALGEEKQELKEFVKTCIEAKPDVRINKDFVKGLRATLMNAYEPEEKRNIIQEIIESLIQIPVMGVANAGEAVSFADEDNDGYVSVSKKFIPHPENLYAVKVSGTSMNKETIPGGHIENGDFVIVDSTQKSLEEGKPFLFVIDGCATIKRYKRQGQSTILLPNSTDNHQPIFLHPEDTVHVLGEVTRVFKG
ncbi:MAG: hypothetical protein HN726_00445 [Candidatus Magasanikbacteria bacterium]|jgi:SOS-response transcriptional repressor LexA|nr:hypothetical protein [Candidatus Magasanikbacteria bacterium]MBT4221109.1 hypothetical protein [Candidatus Magasanikbacteria bacterium]MBT4350321.1 hypothetical protein [Candidatus Magasanikbacteria bacterium]MBT4541747.1 hypothetical protein [Candidatus Magasanikbacteria bacterium]MBT6253276.1 hypothetical protein [Candidatus Magasanikbacteria bacterium]